MGRFTKRITRVVPVPDDLALHVDHKISDVTISRLSYGQEEDLEAERYAELRARVGDEFMIRSAEAAQKKDRKGAPDDAPEVVDPILVAIVNNGPIHSLLRKCVIAFDGEPIKQSELAEMEEVVSKKDAHWLAEQILRHSKKLPELVVSENGAGSDSTPT